MNTDELKALAVNTLHDLKGQEIRSLKVDHLCDFTDVMIFCTGTSNRHVKSLAQRVIEVAKQQGCPLLGYEGKEEGDWVLIDLGDIIIHIMQEEIRQFYQIEELWDMEPEP